MSNRLDTKQFLVLLALVSMLGSGALIAQPPVVFGELYYEETIVGTVIPPASMPKRGRDNLYVVPDQRAVIGVAPGDKGYHGGQWAVHVVSWNVEPYLLTSEAAVLDAMMSGHVCVVRVETMDFKCPVQP